MLARPRLLVVLPLLAFGALGCPDDGPPAPTADTSKVPATPTAVPTAAPTGTPSAAPKPPPPPAPTVTAEASASAAATTTDTPPPTLLGTFAKAAKIKLRRVTAGNEVVIEAADEVKGLLDAIGLDQTPGEMCPRCIPDVQLVFEDDIGTRLGSLGLFCEGTESKVAVLRDALANDCKTILPKDAAVLEAAVKKAFPAATP